MSNLYSNCAFLYKLKLINNTDNTDVKYYIGSTINLKRRFKNHTGLYRKQAPGYKPNRESSKIFNKNYHVFSIEDIKIIKLNSVDISENKKKRLNDLTREVIYLVEDIYTYDENLKNLSRCNIQDYSISGGRYLYPFMGSKSMNWKEFKNKVYEEKKRIIDHSVPYSKIDKKVDLPFYISDKNRFPNKVNFDDKKRFDEWIKIITSI